MTEYAKIVIEDNVLYVFHPENGNRAIGDKLNQDLEVALEKLDKSKQIIMCNDLTKAKISLDKDITEYKKTGEEFMTSHKHWNMVTIFVVSNPVIRVLAGAISIISGQKIHYFKNMDEARNFIKITKAAK